MATISRTTRTVMACLEHTTYVTVDGKVVVPECVTRFSPGTRVWVKHIKDGKYAVSAAGADDVLRVFGEENWHLHV